MDKIGADFQTCLQMIRDRLGAKAGADPAADRLGSRLQGHRRPRPHEGGGLGRRRPGRQLPRRRDPGRHEGDGRGRRATTWSRTPSSSKTTRMEAYLDGEEPAEDDLKTCLRKARADRRLLSDPRAARPSRTRASSRCSTPWSTTCRRRWTSRRPGHRLQDRRAESCAAPPTTSRCRSWRSRSWTTPSWAR